MTAITPRAEDEFVRFPKQYIHLPITPQAKVLLMALCAHADSEGKSYCSYAQLGEIAQRSKASISAYVRELQEAGLIHCTRQRYGNGYNYRLLITLIGWRDLLAHWERLSQAKRARMQGSERSASHSVVTLASRREVDAPADRPEGSNPHTSVRERTRSCSKPSERRVQPAERKDPSGPKTKIHQIKTHRVVWSEEDEAEWRRFRPRDDDPPSAVHRRPSADLLRRAIEYFGRLAEEPAFLEKEAAEQLAREALHEFVAARKLEATGEEILKASSAIAGRARTTESIAAAISALARTWRPHWRRLSTTKQIIDACASAIEAALPPIEDRRRASRARGRAWIASIHLPKELNDAAPMEEPRKLA